MSLYTLTLRPTATAAALLLTLGVALGCSSSGSPNVTNNAGGTKGSEDDDGIDPDNSSSRVDTIIVNDPTTGCIPTGEEICDGIDNDCNDLIDDGIDLTRAQSCGTCQLDCTRTPNVTVPTCEPPEDLSGVEPGTCGYEACAADFYDLDGELSNGCEYFCSFNSEGTNETDDAATGCGIDDDCDGLIDEDLDLCADANNCGVCGRGCDIAGVHATFKCTSRAREGVACSGQNTVCEVEACEDGYFDSNGDPADGCEYLCTQTNDGEEICDGLDNDCDRLIDNVDPDLEDAPSIGSACFGGEDGICAESSHSGITKCVAGQEVCCDRSSNDAIGTNPALPVTGLRNGLCGAPNVDVLAPGTEVELCNGLDDDCDGTVDDAPTDVGGSCGLSKGACLPGTYQCAAGGALVCVGDTQPTQEVCNGIDDDCDGVVDGTLNGAPVLCTVDDDCPGVERCLPTDVGTTVCAIPSSDSIGSCTTSGTTYPDDSPCSEGQLRCLSGAMACIGEVLPQASSDTCGEDTNCDGLLSGQPDFDADVTNCGGCGIDCTQLYTGAVAACVNGACQVPTTCKAGRIDCGGADDWDCETLCTKTSDTETCNGVDDDCNCFVDDIDEADIPAPTEVCGVDENATDAACTGAHVSCAGGAWKCQFSPGYCDAGDPFPCAGVLDLCDDRDNDCDGNIDEDVQGKGAVCYSDEASDVPHGLCQSAGIRICDPEDTESTVCPAEKNTAAASAEVCDGEDNDCDGQVDEGVTPDAVAVASGLWVMAYEASRPHSTATTAGTGNGYWVSTLTPAGTLADETLACSEPNRVPWVNVSPAEVAQTCSQIGGRMCTVGDWQTACEAASSCAYGYASSCQTSGSYPGGNPSCNVSENWPSETPAIKPTADASLSGCYADLSAGDIYDITGNVRELVFDEAASDPNCIPEAPEETGCVFRAMGGTYQSLESAAACGNDFLAVDSDFRLYNTGFRCCFDSNPN